jgi:cytochrome c-type biogenesis protein CcmH/NrfF
MITAFGKFIQSEMPEPGSNNNFLWAVLIMLLVWGIAYVVIRKNKEKEKQS